MNKILNQQKIDKISSNRRIMLLNSQNRKKKEIIKIEDNKKIKVKKNLNIFQ
jgi:hypothetical protein